MYHSKYGILNNDLDNKQIKNISSYGFSKGTGSTEVIPSQSIYVPNILIVQWLGAKLCSIYYINIQQQFILPISDSGNWSVSISGNNIQITTQCPYWNATLFAMI